LSDLPGIGDIGEGLGLGGAGIALAPATGGASLLPAIGSVVGDVASGVLGLVGANAENQNAEAAQQSAMNYDTYMADTQYQRGMADMKAAGLNPMLAYMQGGDSAPTAPMYQPSTPLSTLPDAVSNLGDDLADAVKKYGASREQTANANSAETASQVAAANAPAQIQQQQAQADKSNSDATTAAVNAAVSQAGESASKFGAKYGPYVDMASKVGNSVSNAVDAWSIVKGLKWLGAKKFNPDTTGTFDLKTGEIHQ